MKPVHIILFENSKEPLNGEVRAFATKDLAKKALKKHISVFVKAYPHCSADAWESFYENDSEAYGVTIEEGEDFYAHIETIPVEEE